MGAQLPGLRRACQAQGRRGAWVPARASSDHHMVRSGCVAILAPKHIVITQGLGAASRWHAHGLAQWARTRSLHLFSTYAHDVSYGDRAALSAELCQRAQLGLAQRGRAPWVLWGDFIQEPSEELLGWPRRATVAAPPQPTHTFGRIIG